MIIIFSFSTFSFANNDEPSDSSFPKGRVSASVNGEGDPQSEIPVETLNQSGVLAPGATAANTQVSTCVGCEHRSGLRLGDNTNVQVTNSPKDASKQPSATGQ